jgi:hypothetical protein
VSVKAARITKLHKEDTIMGVWFIYFILMEVWDSEVRDFVKETRCGTILGSGHVGIHQRIAREEWGWELPDGHGSIHAFRVDDEGRPVSESTKCWARVGSSGNTWGDTTFTPERLVEGLFDRYDDEATLHHLLVETDAHVEAYA